MAKVIVGLLPILETEATSEGSSVSVSETANAPDRALLLPEFQMPRFRASGEGKSLIPWMEWSEEEDSDGLLPLLRCAFLGAEGDCSGAVPTFERERDCGSGAYPRRLRNSANSPTGRDKQGHGDAICLACWQACPETP